MANKDDQLILYGHIEEIDEALFEDVIRRHAELRQQKLQEKVQHLEQEKQGADFFGDDEAATAIEEQITHLQAPAAPAPVLSGRTVSMPQTKGLTKRWVFRVTNPNLVPRAYLVVDEKLIREKVASGARSIPGVEIYQEDSISIR